MSEQSEQSEALRRLQGDLDCHDSGGLAHAASDFERGGVALVYADDLRDALDALTRTREELEEAQRERDEARAALQDAMSVLAVIRDVAPTVSDGEQMSLAQQMAEEARAALARAILARPGHGYG